jgi:hypothetical protein
LVPPSRITYGTLQYAIITPALALAAGFLNWGDLYVSRGGSAMCFGFAFLSEFPHDFCAVFMFEFEFFIFPEPCFDLLLLSNFYAIFALFSCFDSNGSFQTQLCVV